MGIDKDKVAKEALRFIQKGQFQKAIEEYRRVLSSDPRDIRTRLKLVDLYGRVGSTKEAIDECLHVAESYSDQGFYLKAIAVYKQALRIDPKSPHLYRSVGELYVKQGLIGDALAAFKRAVDILRQLGRPGDAEEVLARMEEMAPENVAIKIHLAELYLADGRMSAFEDELDKIFLQLKGDGRTRKLLQAMEGFYAKAQGSPSFIKRLAELYADHNEDEKVLEIIRPPLSQNPADRDLRLLALRAHLALGDLVEARRMALGLYEEDPGDLYILEQLCAIAQAKGERTELVEAHRLLAKAYGQKGLSAKEEAHFRKVLELSPQDAEARVAVGDMVVPAQEESRPRERERPIEIEGFWPDEEEAPPDVRSAVRDGLTEVDLYLKYGMEERAAEKLSELCVAAPDDIELHQKLRDLYQRRGDRSGWVQEQLRISELFLDRNREADALRSYQAILEVDPQNADAMKGIALLKPDAAPSATATLQLTEAGGFPSAEVGDTEGTGPSSVPNESARIVNLQEMLEEADFFVAQDRTDQAIELLVRLRERYPASTDIATRLERLGWQEPEDDSHPSPVNLQTEVLDASSAAFAAAPGTPQDFDITDLDDIVREFKSSIAEKLEEGDFETHYNLGIAYKEMGLQEDALREFQIAARSTERAREAYTSMAMLFQEEGKTGDARAALRMALAVPTNTAEDRAAILYELGVVATDEEDWSGALQAFEKAAALVPTFRDVTRQIQTIKARGL